MIHEPHCAATNRDKNSSKVPKNTPLLFSTKPIWFRHYSSLSLLKGLWRVYGTQLLRHSKWIYSILQAAATNSYALWICITYFVCVRVRVKTCCSRRAKLMHGKISYTHWLLFNKRSKCRGCGLYFYYAEQKPLIIIIAIKSASQYKGDDDDVEKVIARDLHCDGYHLQLSAHLQLIPFIIVLRRPVCCPVISIFVWLVFPLHNIRLCGSTRARENHARQSEKQHTHTHTAHIRRTLGAGTGIYRYMFVCAHVPMIIILMHIMTHDRQTYVCRVLNSWLMSKWINYARPGLRIHIIIMQQILPYLLNVQVFLHVRRHKPQKCWCEADTNWFISKS